MISEYVLFFKEMSDQKWDAGNETIPCKIHLFGVNELTTQEVLALFDTAGGAEKVEWLDDASCNVFLSDDEKVEAILNGYAISENGWARTDPIPLEGKEPVILDLRRATTTDVKSQGRTWKHSEFYRKRLEKEHVIMVPAKGTENNGILLRPSPRNSRTVVTRSGLVLEPRRHRRSRSRGRSRSRSRDDWERKDKSMGMLSRAKD